MVDSGHRTRRRTAESELEQLIAEQQRDDTHRVRRRAEVSLNHERDPEQYRRTDTRCGTLTSYTDYRCRCDLCRETWRIYQREWKRHWRARLKAQGVSCP